MTRILRNPPREVIWATKCLNATILGNNKFYEWEGSHFACVCAYLVNLQEKRIKISCPPGRNHSNGSHPLNSHFGYYDGSILRYLLANPAIRRCAKKQLINATIKLRENKLLSSSFVSPSPPPTGANHLETWATAAVRQGIVSSLSGNG